MAEVQYFAVDLSTFLVTTAVAYQTPTSQDFNPALAVADNGVDGVVYLTWAYTDVERGIPVTLTVGWVGPGDPITDLLSEGSDVVSSSAAGTTAPYGPTSGIAVATGTKGACNPYRAVVITGEYFSSDGSWVSPVSEVGDCGRSS